MYRNRMLRQIFSLTLIGLLLLAACSQPTTSTTSPTQAPTEAPTETAAPPTATPAPAVTDITIDGDPSDWEGYDKVHDDPAGDAEEGFLDLTTGYAFVNQNALYLLVETADAQAPFVQFDLMFQADGRSLLISWSPGQPGGFIGDVTAGYEPGGPTTNSTFALGPALEARMDLRDMGSPESLNLLQINVMVGECCEYPTWHAADEWRAGPTPMLNEIDPAWLTGAEVVLTEAPAQEVATPQLTSPEVTEATIAPPETPAPPTVTDITIDGDSSDWGGYDKVHDDPVGDAEEGFLDLTTGYAFVNQNALYLLVETVNAQAPFVQLDLMFQADDRRLQISWQPNWDAGQMGDTTTGYEPLGPALNSTFALGPFLEGRVDLKDIGTPEYLTLTQINVMVGECCTMPAWHAADDWNPGSTPVVNEVDPPRMVSDEPKYVLARRFQLPEGHVAERLFAPPAPDLTGITRSQDGTVFLLHGGLSMGISIVDPDSGEVMRILDLPPETAGYNSLIGGPDDTAFIPVGFEIWQVSSDGSHEVWGQAADGWPGAYTSDDRLLGRSGDQTRVLELFPDGGSREIAGGFAQIYDIVAADDGTLFVSDIETGNITRVDSDGTQRTLAEHVLFRDPLDLGLDFSGDLYLSSVTSRFVRVNPNTGAFTLYDSADSPCTGHEAEFIFTEPGRVLFMDPTESQVSWADLNTGENGLFVPNQGSNTSAAAIGPDDMQYIGVGGCGDEIPAQVVRVSDDGTREVIVDGLRGRISDIAFAPDGGLYVATLDPDNNSPVFYVPSEGGDPIRIPDAAWVLSLTVDPHSGHLLVANVQMASVQEFTLDGLVAQYPVRFPKPPWDFYLAFAPDGTLYAYASEAARQQTGPVVERWILKLDLESGSSEIVFQSDRQGCCVMGNLTVDSHGNIWWMAVPPPRIYRVTPNGETMLFAQNLPIDPASIVVDSRGDVYFTSSGGIYRIYPEP